MDFSRILAGFGHGVVFVIISILFIWLAKWIDDRRTTAFDDDDQVDQGNKAVGIRKAGLYLAIAIAFSGALSGESKGLASDIVYLLIDGCIILVCLFSSRFINDRVLLGHIRNDEECMKEFALPSGVLERGNTAVGIVECCMYIATGFILAASLTGMSMSLTNSIISTILFFVLGQFALLLSGYIYELITPFGIREEIQDNNAAAALGLGGTLVALGIILYGSIKGPFTGWFNDIASFSLYFVYGLLMLFVVKFLLDKFLLPTTKISVEIEKDRNVSAIIVIESAINAIAVIVAFSM